MKECPRCHTSMLFVFEDTARGYPRSWQCLACGREFLEDPVEQARDEEARARILQTKHIRGNRMY